VDRPQLDGLDVVGLDVDRPQLDRVDLVGFDLVVERLGHEFGGGPMTNQSRTNDVTITVRGRRRGVIWD
jgi:hypothetical protein